MTVVDYAAIPEDLIRPKRKGDWTGRLVRLRHQLISNGGHIYAAGKVMLVSRNFSGLSLSMRVICPCCGVGRECFIMGVNESACDLLPLNTPPPTPDTLYPPGVKPTGYMSREDKSMPAASPTKPESTP